MVLGACVFIMGMVLTGSMTQLWHFYLFFGLLFGIGVGGEVPTFPVINRQYYGNAPMGTLYGWQNVGNGLGMALRASPGRTHLDPDR